MADYFDNTKSHPCPRENCIGYKCVDVSVPIKLNPNVTVGEIETDCKGATVVKFIEGCNDCTVIVRQTVCLSIPIKYSFSAETGKADLECQRDCRNGEVKPER